ncbi:cryptochrome/photolyase family protein [Legionella pneumophila serogroup 1]|uniref:cryptochrome/photolyase family protein n=1 Tax=Legionella pneumophila TaxID=446 RepID=UPI0005B4CB5D|nr:cryptochrome/photolyase family protein [Legionella pneumophila]ANN91328.1 deoxyribodipyrimidine photolyase [Legionella pneumophila]MCZ4679359.1 cryptochrome/photolyase family protein [Legionella pneumophila]MDI9844186.1 cryptochrome/photolyase family protein [Legionella pneumophila]CZI43821.1 Deoxyribodipyrimidine photo-lyase-related protein [Legionella pneumophila]CZI52628.1 Deoxyribodipyrimidine photo-lyase-related protein [Legionella pneumophila]
MTILCFILGDQLNETIASLAAINKQKDIVFLCEVAEETSYVPHHPKKIAFLFSAMRHFAQQLKKKGYRVRYTAFDDPRNQGSFAKELLRAIEEEQVSAISLTEPGEWRVLKIFHDLKSQLTIPVTLHEDNRFLCKINEFRNWAKERKQLRMEFFYRMMRQKYHLLVDNDGKPVGGSWNYDAQNRKNANHISSFPKRLEHTRDVITDEVLGLVSAHFAKHFGQCYPFNLAVTREQALEEADYFMEHFLCNFGAYQDAMLKDEISLYHSKLSSYLNAGLLLPLELCQMAEQAYFSKQMPLNSVEGFIRQILGWREYVRGIYWLFMPDYGEMNYFNACRPLPSFFWGEETGMFCIKEVVRQTSTEAYSHHIQRLMITGNFALLAGLDPKQVCEWYLAVYADAYEWVELPNTLGMALYADGGLMASKPYAASGKYIHRMSNFCQSCYYNPNNLLGEKACPFNALYWNFLHQNQEKLKDNPRLRYAYMNWQKMDFDKQKKTIHKAQRILADLDSANL